MGKSVLINFNNKMNTHISISCFLFLFSCFQYASARGTPLLRPFVPNVEQDLEALPSLPVAAPKVSSNATSCPICILVKSSTTVQTAAPWLFNNQQARFNYMRTDEDDYAVYQYIGGQGMVYYLHFYDEGFFYNGFWVINDMEIGYQEENGRVFVYNSDYDACPDDSGRNWYYWFNNAWSWDDSIYLQSC